MARDRDTGQGGATMVIIKESCYNQTQLGWSVRRETTARSGIRHTAEEISLAAKDY
jgi:hypothetical protein